MGISRWKKNEKENEWKEKSRPANRQQQQQQQQQQPSINSHGHVVPKIPQSTRFKLTLVFAATKGLHV
jgi:hypothetical protein